MAAAGSASALGGDDAGGLPRATLRALLEAAPFLGRAFAPRAEAAAGLLSHPAASAALDDLDPSGVAAVALGCCGLLDRGRHSRRGADEHRRRAAAARAVLERLCRRSRERTTIAAAALGACLERCGTARPEESSESESERRAGDGAGENGRPYGAARQLRRAWRGLAVVAAVDDDDRRWRCALVLRTGVAVAERAYARGARDAKVRAQVEELLRLCKRDAAARAWAASDEGANALRWLEPSAFAAPKSRLLRDFRPPRSIRRRRGRGGVVEKSRARTSQ